MTNRDDEAIARQEADETFHSITDLDSIADTVFVALTFLLAALGTWTSFVFDRLGQFEFLPEVYISLVAACGLSVAGSVYFLSRALSPRGFYGSAVGEEFLDHPWLLWRNDDAIDIQSFQQRREQIEDETDLRAGYEEWLGRYDPSIELDSREQFEFSRLLNYKVVARKKACYTAYGIALFRVAVFLLVLVILTSILVPLVAG